MKRERTVAPTVEPVTLDDIRKWLAFQNGVTDDDELVEDLVDEVIAYLEGNGTHLGVLNGHVMCTQTWKLTLDADEIASVIYPRIVPLSSVSSITTYDDDGASTSVASSNYQVTTGLVPRIAVTADGEWPTDVRDHDAMEIVCVCGYGGASAVPADVKMLIKGLVLHHYSAKGLGVQQTVSGQLISVPYQFERMIDMLRVTA
ncbi:MAG: hypothetical protein AMJ69_12725 [Gammaproteobacteria bacterium SG8_47]|nr:MAG: hypothetical protein AMJ69_12725 [Gammaproteobacteria bacterium SG8_47]